MFSPLQATREPLFEVRPPPAAKEMSRRARRGGGQVPSLCSVSLVNTIVATQGTTVGTAGQRHELALGFRNRLVQGWTELGRGQGTSARACRDVAIHVPSFTWGENRGL